MSNQDINAGYIDEVRSIDQRLDEIETERQELQQRKKQLLNQSKSPSAQTILSTEQKVSVFKNLFRGRSDIYATRWQNTQGRSGYAVACKNLVIRTRHDRSLEK